MGYTRALIACSIAGGIYLAYAGYSALVLFLKPQTVSLTIDAYFPRQTYTLLQDLITPDILTKHTAHTLATYLKPYAPALEKVIICLKASRNAHIKLTAQIPCVALAAYKTNENFILTDQQQILPTTAYEAFIDPAKKIICYEYPLPAAELHQFSHLLLPEIYENYAVHWHNKTSIFLTPLHDNDPHLLTTHTTPIPLTLLTMIARCHEESNKKDDSLKLKTSHKKNRVYDIRFKNHIIVKQIKGGIL